MKSLGLDLSMVNTGVSLLEDGKLVLKESIITKKRGDTPREEVTRLKGIVNNIITIVDEHQPDIVAIEGLAFMSRNTTALSQLSALNYMVRVALVERNISFIIVAPTSLKKFATGKGNAQKDEVMLSLYKKYGVSLTDNNQADAYALAQAGLAVLGHDGKINTVQKDVINLITSQLN